MGAKALKKCFPDLLPAQEALLLSSRKFDYITKQRYLNFFKQHLEGFEVYPDDSQMIPMAQTAINWLIVQTRNAEKFPLIAEENMNLGFAYNLLGLKPISIPLLLVTIVTNMLLLRNGIFLEFDKSVLIICLIIDTLLLLTWIFIITQKLVKDCANKYARALLSACDSPNFKQSH